MSFLKKAFAVENQSQLASIGLLLLRIVAGLAMVMHGMGKIQSPFSWMGPDSTIPGFFQLLAAVSEFGGGIAWILGLLNPLASLGIISTMVVAVYTHMIKNGDPFVGKGGPSYELAAIYLAISIVFLFVGPGKFSLDSLIFKSKDSS